VCFPWQEARRHRPHPEIAAQRLQLSYTLRIEWAVLHTAAAELVTIYSHDRIPDAHVLVVRHVGNVHDLRVVDDHVVHDAWTAPAAPVRPANETAIAPPRDDRFTEAERNPAHERQTDADRYTRRSKERH
jgi:hypothetical protein